MPRVKTRKRPCRICRRWFLPDVRQKDRQKTCGAPECRAEWHRRQCEKWNKKNRVHIKANYLAKKLDRIKDPPSDSGASSCPFPTVLPSIPGSRINLDLPRDIIQDVIGAKPLVITEYIIEQIVQRQKAIRFQPPVIASKTTKMPP